MWVPAQVVDWFKISKESVDALREDLAGIRAERDALKAELLTVKANFEWLRVRVNTLEMERTQLMKVAYHVDLPAPEIVRQAKPSNLPDSLASMWDDVGEDIAKQLGMPQYER